MCRFPCKTIVCLPHPEYRQHAPVLLVLSPLSTHTIRLYSELAIRHVVRTLVSCITLIVCSDSTSECPDECNALSDIKLGMIYYRVGYKTKVFRLNLEAWAPTEGGGGKNRRPPPWKMNIFFNYMWCFLQYLSPCGGGGGVAFSPCRGCFAIFHIYGGGGLFWPAPLRKFLRTPYVCRLALVCIQQHASRFIRYKITLLI